MERGSGRINSGEQTEEIEGSLAASHDEQSRSSNYLLQNISGWTSPETDSGLDVSEEEPQVGPVHL